MARHLKTNTQPPIGSRATSYNSIPQVLHEAATGSRASTPPKFKPQVHQNIDPPRNSAKLRTHEEALRPARQSYDGSSSEHPGRPHHDTQPEHPSKQDQGSKNPPKPGHGPEVRVTAKPAPKPSSKSPPKSPPKSLPNKSANLFKMIPEALAAYGGLEALSEHADTAKGWADWLNQIRDAPEEIHGLSAKVQTARDTITQIQNTLEARPDLVEGDSGQRLRSQIEAAIKSSNEVLTKMTKVLQDLSETTAEDGSIMSGVQEFYNSYKYRNEYENKIKEADGELQKELSGLSTLMINLYSRSLMKPAPSGSIAPTPPPVPITSTTEETKTNKKTPPTDDMTTPAPAEEKPPTPAETSSGAHLDGLEPPPIPQLPREHNRDNDARPPSPSTVGEEEANIGLGTKPAGVPATTHPTPPNSTSSPSETKDEAAAESKSDQKQPSATSATPAPKEDPKEALLDAAWYGDLEAASEALRHAPVTVCDQKGLTPLHLAAERDNLAMAMLLLDHHADANSRANGGRTPLHLASRFASAATVELLVEDGHANTNARTTDGRTPLHYAASSAEDGDEERREVVRVLRDWDADPTAEDAKGRTPRDVAQKRDYWDISSTLRRAEKRWEDDHPQGWFQRHGFRK
ncbi:Fc.00g033010.m01.CDS01 [Cosmosporella sp. VM-42]